MRVAAPLVLRSGDREKLAKMASSRAGEAGLARRARIVLLAADGLPHTEIAERCGTSVPTVREWRSRYRAGGIRALEDLPRSGRPRTVDEAAVVVATLAPPPRRLGVSHWSSRLLAGEVGIYLNPPENAVVVCVDEKSQIQALDRTQPILPIRPGLPERATHDYIRHGVTTPFAALEVATGQVVDACYPRHRHQEFLRFLKKVAAAWPGTDLHVVCDNYATHNHPEVKAWLARNPRVTLHFTPTGCSWLNMVEIFFGILTRQAIRRGTYRSVKDLTAKIGEFTGGWNERCQPFVWTKSAEELLAKIRKKETSRAGH